MGYEGWNLRLSMDFYDGKNLVMRECQSLLRVRVVPSAGAPETGKGDEDDEDEEDQDNGGKATTGTPAATTIATEPTLSAPERGKDEDEEENQDENQDKCARAVHFRIWKK